jgi:uncharacterized membrane protein YbaN (DUF454 family)
MLSYANIADKLYHRGSDSIRNFVLHTTYYPRPAGSWDRDSHITQQKKQIIDQTKGFSD